MKSSLLLLFVRPHLVEHRDKNDVIIISGIYLHNSLRNGLFFCQDEEMLNVNRNDYDLSKLEICLRDLKMSHLVWQMKHNYELFESLMRVMA